MGIIPLLIKKLSTESSFDNREGNTGIIGAAVGIQAAAIGDLKI